MEHKEDLGKCFGEKRTPDLGSFEASTKHQRALKSFKWFFYKPLAPSSVKALS